MEQLGTFCCEVYTDLSPSLHHYRVYLFFDFCFLFTTSGVQKVRTKSYRAYLTAALLGKTSEDVRSSMQRLRRKMKRRLLAETQTLSYAVYFPGWRDVSENVTMPLLPKNSQDCVWPARQVVSKMVFTLRSCSWKQRVRAGDCLSSVCPFYCYCVHLETPRVVLQDGESLEEQSSILMFWCCCTCIYLASGIGMHQFSF